MGGTSFEEFEPERLVKSSERVRDLGEVFTPANIVDDMLNLLPSDMWAVHPSRTFLEPSVGNGNFVSAVLSRKLTKVDALVRSKKLPAGDSLESAQFHALEALSSIYGVDISEDNIIGGTPGHEIACRPRLLEIMHRWFEKVTPSGTESTFLRAASWIVDHNMIIGNMLEKDSMGKPTGRESLPIIEYEWFPESMEVALGSTTLGDVLEEAEENSSDLLSLFGPMPAVQLWKGAFNRVHEAPQSAQQVLTGRSVSNSQGAK